MINYRFIIIITIIIIIIIIKIRYGNIIPIIDKIKVNYQELETSEPNDIDIEEIIKE